MNWQRLSKQAEPPLFTLFRHPGIFREQGGSKVYWVRNVEGLGCESARFHRDLNSIAVIASPSP